MNAYTSAYAERNPGAQAVRNSKRKQRGGHVSITDEERTKMWKRQDKLCLCCGQPIADPVDTQVDHGDPVGKGGGHDPVNLFVAHHQCNEEKHAKTLEEHWAWRIKVGLQVDVQSLRALLSKCRRRTKDARSRQART